MIDMFQRVRRYIRRWRATRKLDHTEAARMFRHALYGDHRDPIRDRNSLMRLLARRALTTAPPDERSTWERFERATRRGHRVGSVTGRIVYLTTVPVDSELAADVESAFSDKE